MLTLADCIAFSGFTEEEVLAIAEHEHIPETAACSMAEYLSRSQSGENNIRDMIIGDIRNAQNRGDQTHVRELLHVLHHFLRTHPRAIPKMHPWSSKF